MWGDVLFFEKNVVSLWVILVGGGEWRGCVWWIGGDGKRLKVSGVWILEFDKNV